MVGLQQSAETLDADDLTLTTLMLWRDDLVNALVNPFVVIVFEILGENVAQLFFGGENKVIETLLSDGPHEPLRVGIQIRTARWQFHGFHAGGFENAVELVRVQRIAVVDQVLLAGQEAALTTDIASNLLHPRTIRLCIDAEDLHFAGGDVYGEEHHVPDELAFDEELNGEQIAGGQHIPVAFEELLPGGLAGQVRLGIVAAFQEDILDRGLADLVPQVDEVIPNSRVAPARVLLFEADHEIDDLLRDLGPPGMLAVLAAIVFLSNESAVPRQNGLRREENRGLLQELSGQLFALRGQPHPLMIVEQNAFVLFLLFLQDLDLLLEVLDRLPEFLVKAVR